MFKKLTSFFRFYYHTAIQSPKRYEIPMKSDELAVIGMTPLFLMLITVFGAFALGGNPFIAFIWLPLFFVNMLFVHHMADRGRKIERVKKEEEDKARRKAEREERARREEEDLRRRMRENEERRRRDFEEFMRRKMREEQAFHERQRQREAERQREAYERAERFKRWYEQDDWSGSSRTNTSYSSHSSVDRNMENAKKLLNLPDNFTAKDVKSAYRRLSKIHHPDVGGTEVNFKKLKTAYDYVMDRI